ncbi:uncharacterized protein TNCV_4835951 [Trichonephila clavipes]|nr:uncharacterized protein TNCV_4835951 [Trichonephila clavipes]
MLYPFFPLRIQPSLSVHPAAACIVDGNDRNQVSRPTTYQQGCGSPVVKVSDHGKHVMSSSPVPLKTRRVGQRCMLNLSRAETSSRWCGVVVRRGDEAHFWLNGYVNKQNCLIWSEANPQVYVETLLHPEKLTVWCALWAGGILLQKR